MRVTVLPNESSDENLGLAQLLNNGGGSEVYDFKEIC